MIISEGIDIGHNGAKVSHTICRLPLDIDHASKKATPRLYRSSSHLHISITYLAMLWSAAANCHMIKDVSTNTGTGLPTTMVTGVETESRLYTYATGHTIFAYLCGGGTVGSSTVADCIKMFDKDGNLLASSSARTDPINTQKIAFQLKDPMKVIYTVVNFVIAEQTLTYNAPNYALAESQFKNYSPSAYLTLSYADPASVDNYVYVAGHSTDKKLYKFDRTNINSIVGSASVTSMDFDRVLHRVKPGSPYLINAGKSFIMTYINTVTMSTAGAPAGRNTGIEFRLGRVENTASNDYIYCAMLNATIVKYELIGGCPTVVTSAAYFLVTNTESKGFSLQLVDLSTYQYIALTRESDAALLLLKRSDLTLASTVNYHDGLATSYSAMIGPYFDSGSSQYYFTRLENTNKNFQSYYLLFDNCTYRGSNDVCTNCLTGYYRNTTLAGGDCILPAHFLPSHGINAPSILMSPCSTGCISCLLNYQMCLQCDLPTGYYLNSSSSLCYQKASFGAGRGAMLVNASAGQVVGCQDANCISCIDNYGTCIQCNLGTGYYLNPLDSKCYNKAQFVPGNGVQAVNVSAALVSPCTSTGCVSCVDNYGTCLQCNLGTGYYINATNGNCYPKPAFGAGRGAKVINASAAEVSACSSTGCISCTDFYQTCLQCNSASNYYLNTATSACVTYSAMTSGTGANLVTGAVSPCTEPHCTDCTTDYTACSACDTGSQYYHYSANISCLKQSTMPPRLGPNTGTGSVESCTDANCVNCTTTKATCRTCDSTASYYQYSGNCIQPAAFPPHYGVHTATLEVRPCVDTFCGVCLTDNLVCTTCFVTSGHYLYITACILPEDSPSGYGADLFRMLIDICQVANCTSCQNDRSTCQGCDISAGAVLANGSCKAMSSLPAGYGVKTSDGTAQPCADSQCPDCRDNYLVCSQCAAGKYSLNGNCVNKGSIQSGYGIDTATNKVLLCADEHCKGCLGDYQTCTECDQANGYTLDAGKCVQRLEKLKLLKAKYNTIDQISEATFDSPINKVFIDELNISIVDDAQGKTHRCGNQNCTLSIAGSILYVTLKFEFEIQKGELYIEKDYGTIESADRKKAFEDYPIKIINVFHIDVTSSYSSAMKTTSKTVETAKALLNIIGMTISPAASVMLDKMLANFMYLELLTGPFLVYPNYVFKAARGLNMIPFRMGNPFEKWGQQTSCVPLDNFVLADYNCGFFANYGEDFFGLMITLAINIVISLSCILAILIILDRKAAKGFEPLSSQRSMEDQSAPAKKPTDWIEVYTWIGDNYGVKFFFIHTRSEAIKILCFSVLNLFATQDSSFIAVGTGFSVYWLAFYALKLIFLTSIINTVWGRHKEQNPASPSATDLAVKKRVKIEHSYLWFLDFYFEEIHIGKMRWSLFLPVMEVARCIVISLLVYLMASTPVAQHSIAGVVELAYMIFLLKSNVKIKIAETVFECFIGIMHIVYIIMRYLSTREMDEQTRQTKYGMPMAGILVAMIAVELTIAIIILLYLIFLLGKWLKKKLMKKSRISNRNMRSNRTSELLEPRSPMTAGQSLRNGLGRTNTANSRQKRALRSNKTKIKNKGMNQRIENIDTINGHELKQVAQILLPESPTRANRAGTGATLNTGKTSRFARPTIRLISTIEHESQPNTPGLLLLLKNTPDKSSENELNSPPKMITPFIGNKSPNLFKNSSALKFKSNLDSIKEDTRNDTFVPSSSSKLNRFRKMKNQDRSPTKPPNTNN